MNENNGFPKSLLNKLLVQFCEHEKTTIYSLAYPHNFDGRLCENPIRAGS